MDNSAETDGSLSPAAPSGPENRTRAGSGMINRILAGRYEVLEIVGEGPLLAAFRARDRSANRIVAVKTLLPAFDGRPDLVEKLKTGIGQTLSLTHNNIMRTFDVGVDSETNTLFLAEEYLRGIDLRERIRRTAPFQLSAATDTAIAIVEALEFAHARGIAHGDVRPQNILIGPEGQVKLTGFGIAQTQASVVATDPALLMRVASYIAPEAARAAVPTTSADLYAVGVLLFEMLTGDLPYSGDNPLQVALKHAQDPVPSPRQVNTGVPVALDGIIRKALGKTPEERYVSATAFLHDLRSVRDALRFGKSLSWSPLVAAQPPRPTPSASPIPAGDTGSLRTPHVLTAASAAAAEAAAAGAAAAATTGADGTQVMPVPRLSTATIPAPSGAIGGQVSPYANSGGSRDPYAPIAQTMIIEEEEDARPMRSSSGGGGGSRWLTALNLFLLLLVLGGIGTLAYATFTFLQPGSDVTVPNLVGKSLAEAKSIALEQKFRLAIIDEEYRDKEKSGIIFQMKPEAGRHIREGKDVSIWVSKGPRMVEVPDVRDMGFDKARKTLERAGLRLGSYKGEYDPLTPRGNVLRQLPEYPESRPRGTKIDLVLSKGEEPVPTPEPIETPPPYTDTTDESGSVAPDTEPTPRPSTGDDAANASRVRVFDIRYSVPSEGDPDHRIRVDVLDDDGPRTVLDETRKAGDTVKQRVQAIGKKITIKLYDNDVLRKELTQ